MQARHGVVFVPSVAAALMMTRAAETGFAAQFLYWACASAMLVIPSSSKMRAATSDVAAVDAREPIIVGNQNLGLVGFVGFVDTPITGGF